MIVVGPYCTNCGYLIGEGICKCNEHNGGSHCTWCSWNPCKCGRSGEVTMERAFPTRSVEKDYSGHYDWEIHYGMTLRDYFAAVVLQGMHANPELMEFVTKEVGIPFKILACKAYEQADAMMEARKVK